VVELPNPRTRATHNIYTGRCVFGRVGRARTRRRGPSRGTRSVVRRPAGPSVKPCEEGSEVKLRWWARRAGEDKRLRRDLH
jgi:hypothetical protein